MTTDEQNSGPTRATADDSDDATGVTKSDDAAGASADGGRPETGGGGVLGASLPDLRKERETTDASRDRGRGLVAASVDGPDVEAGADPDEVDLSNPAYYLNRELSELAFQQRVLHEAFDERNPPLERAKFLAIFTRNMDEFFMKRVGGLKQQIDAGVTELTADGRTPEQQWNESLDRSHEMLAEQARCYRDLVRPALDAAGVSIAEFDDLSADQRAAFREYFESSVLPTLTPLTFDPAHPFPFISNLSLSLAVLTRDGEDTDEDVKFSRVKIPNNRPRLVRLRDVVTDADDPDGQNGAGDADRDGDGDGNGDGDGDGNGDGDGDGGDRARFVRLEQVIEANLDLLFPNVEVVHSSLFRVTRNAEVRRNEEVAEGLIEMIEDVLRQRRFATVVRLEVESDMPDEVRNLLVDQLGVSDRELFELDGPLDYRDFMSLLDLDRPDLKLDPWQPKAHPRFAGLDPEAPGDLFAEVARKDVLVHHPYHSFGNTVQAFLDAAASDPHVLAIKATIYRTASDSKVIESLIEAAKNGKQVAVMVELKARFDEENNLRWVKRLEEEGIHVAYGTIGLKTHSKTALVVREEDEEVRLYSHVATGNYHSETAKTYVDLGVLTADRDVGQDLVKLFNYFTGHSLRETYRKLLVAPKNLRTEFVRLIRREAEFAREGTGGRIVVKMNSLEDPEMVRELYAASMAGVDVDLVVRGICRLRPGVPGLSDSVRVHSVVGRFLEHSRIFYFENGGDPEYYIGSADWMVRNLDRRVEAVAPVEDPALREELDYVLDVMLSDNRKRWVMYPDGSYAQLVPGADEPVRNTHDLLADRVRNASSGDPRQAVPEQSGRESDGDPDDGSPDG